jgi:4-diphosphocytidyl-2-C-methyl-D-erythritol kinase
LDRLADAIAQAVIHGATDTEFAPAKINLALHVVGRRPDGYHLLESLVVFANFGDTISAAPGQDGLSLSIDGPLGNELSVMARGDDNLVKRAARLLAGAAGMRSLPQTDIILSKRIPIAAGLGGGSADAAAALRLLDRYWQTNLGPEQLARIGLQLGADLPMCIASRPSIARGVGERIAHAPGIPKLPVVVLHPSIPVATAAVFGKVTDPRRSGLPPLPTHFRSIVSLVQWLRETRNDLVEATAQVTGLAGRASKALAADPDCLFARMTGSGAAAFGIFASRAAAERAATRLGAAHPHWWVAAGETGGS